MGQPQKSFTQLYVLWKAYHFHPINILIHIFGIPISTFAILMLLQYDTPIIQNLELLQENFDIWEMNKLVVINSSTFLVVCASVFLLRIDKTCGLLAATKLFGLNIISRYLYIKTFQGEALRLQNDVWYFKTGTQFLTTSLLVMVIAGLKYETYKPSGVEQFWVYSTGVMMIWADIGFIGKIFDERWMEEIKDLVYKKRKVLRLEMIKKTTNPIEKNFERGTQNSS